MTQEQRLERELLAEYAHGAWSRWVLTVTKQGIDVGTRRLRLAETRYADLPEAEKEFDRAEADKILALLPLSALAERLERAEALLKELVFNTRQGYGVDPEDGCDCNVCEFNRKLSSFLHDGEVKP